jgi:thiamine biosynthesis lipoprotein ApbE
VVTAPIIRVMIVMMKAVCTSEMSVNFYEIDYHNYHHLHNRQSVYSLCKNLGRLTY